LLIEDSAFGSGSGSIPLTSGSWSESGRLNKMWIRFRNRIRIRNTDFYILFHSLMDHRTSTFMTTGSRIRNGIFPIPTKILENQMTPRSLIKNPGPWMGKKSVSESGINIAFLSGCVLR
jgi:hypothetical protein